MSMFRKPHTHGEKAKSADPEIQDLIRAKRKAKNLPDDYDDIQKAHAKHGVQKPKYKQHRRKV